MMQTINPIKENIAFFLPALSFFIYIILASIEFGASLFALFPSLLHEKDIINEYVNPVWETTTVFLVFTFTSMFACFPGATARWGTDLFTITFITLSVFALRIICILLKQYSDAKSRIIDVIYFLTSFIVSVLLSLIALYFLTGSWVSYIKTTLYLWLALSTIFSISTMTLAFFRTYKEDKKHKEHEMLTRFLRLTGTLFFLFSTIFLLDIARDLPYLFVNNHIETWIAGIMLIDIIAILIAESTEAYRTTFALLCVFIATLFWGLFIAHLPYIVYPTATIASSITDSTSLTFIEWGSVLGFIILLPALFLLYRLFVFKKKV